MSSSVIFPHAKETAFLKGNEQESNVALTFNISWGDEKVFDILHTLNEQQISATFFISGEWAEKHPHILEKIIEQKHEIGMLGYRYKSYLQMDIEQVRKDILYAKEVFAKLGFETIEYIRPPSGHFNKEIIQLIDQLGLTAVHWSMNPNDWENPGVDNIVNELKTISNGDIILLHASDSAKQTSDALTQVIPHLKKKQLHFVTISSLLHQIQIDEKLLENEAMYNHIFH